MGRKAVNTANGPRDCNVYLINILLPNSVTVVGILATEADLHGDVGVLIGMDVIREGDFAITNMNNKTVFSYRLPSSQTIDFVKDFRRQQSRRRKKQPKKGQKRR